MAQLWEYIFTSVVALIIINILSDNLNTWKERIVWSIITIAVACLLRFAVDKIF